MKKYIVCFYDVSLIQGFTSGVKQYNIFILGFFLKRSAAEIVQKNVGSVCQKVFFKLYYASYGGNKGLIG